MIPIWSTIGPRICHVPLTDIEQPFPKSSTSSDIQGTYSSKFFHCFLPLSYICHSAVDDRRVEEVEITLENDVSWNELFKDVLNEPNEVEDEN